MIVVNAKRICILLTLLTVVIYQCYCVEICDEISKVPGTDDEYERICVDPDYVDDDDQDDLSTNTTHMERLKVLAHNTSQTANKQLAQSMQELDKIIKDPEFQHLAKRFGRRAVRFLLCMGWKWAKQCGRSIFICGISIDPVNCVRLAVCGSKSILQCVDVLDGPSDYNPLEEVLLGSGDNDNRTVYQRTFDRRNIRAFSSLAAGWDDGGGASGLLVSMIPGGEIAKVILINENQLNA